LTALLAGLLLVFGAAAWYARSLVRPLRALAQAAPGLAAGEPAPEMPAHAVTEIIELAAALDRAAAATRTAAQERQLLLAGLSHDMRTPLARLVLALELIGGDASIRDGMAVDLAELDAILDQFIAFVRDGRDEPSHTVDLGALVDDAIAAQQRAGREWQRRGEQNLSLYAKPLALRRALDNLLENAARHGAAPFHVELHKLANAVSVCVRDRGSGVAAETLHALGLPFYRADIARSSPGSGLGLATVARIAAWHGGTLELRNREGGGFEAELRLVAARS
jgi:two-component system osmolarity sensor histidine kinase EnvZ